MTYNTTVSEFLWSLSLGGISFYGPYGDELLGKHYKNLSEYTSIDDIPSEILHGTSLVPSKKIKRRMDVFLIKRLKLSAKFPYEALFNNLIQQMQEQVLECNHLMLQLNQYTYKELKSLSKTRSDEMSLKLASLEKVYVYKDVWTNDAFFAYNLANAIQLTRLCAFNEVITKEEAITNIIYVGNIIKNHFHSYHDFGQKAALAFAVDKALLKKSDYANDIKNDRHRLSHIIYSCWSYIPWMGGCDDV